MVFAVRLVGENGWYYTKINSVDYKYYPIGFDLCCTVKFTEEQLLDSYIKSGEVIDVYSSKYMHNDDKRRLNCALIGEYHLISDSKFE